MASAPADVQVRSLRDGDIDAVRELHAFAFERLAASHHGPAQLAAHRAFTQTAAYAADLLASHLALAWSGQPGAALLATAGWIAAGEPGAARIRKVFVHPDAARQGLASRLVLDAEDRARAAGFTRLVVRANVNAVPLYRKLGYHAVREGTMDAGGVLLPVVFMAKG